MPRFIKASAVYSSDTIDCPEKRLFVAVLSQAVHDAFSKHVPPYEKTQAQAWLMGNSFDFKTICECAGRNSSYVLEKLRTKILKKNDIIFIESTVFPGVTEQCKNYLEKNPAKRSLPVSSSILFALVDKYPCPKKP